MTTVFGWYHQICNLDLPFQLSPRSFNIIQFYTLAALSRRVQVFFWGAHPTISHMIKNWFTLLPWTATCPAKFCCIPWMSPLCVPNVKQMINSYHENLEPMKSQVHPPPKKTRLSRETYGFLQIIYVMTRKLTLKKTNLPSGSPPTHLRF